MLKIENLHVAVGDNKVLNGLDLEIPTGEVHAIMGPNGSGKSTLAHVLAGRPGYEVTAGSVTFDGRELWGPDGDVSVKTSVDAWESYLEPA